MTRGRGYFISSMNPDTTYENFIYTALGNIFHRRSILLHWVIKKKKRGKRINYTRSLDWFEGRFVTLNIPINRWKYRTFESEIFGLDKKDVENREVELEVIMLIFLGFEHFKSILFFSKIVRKFRFWKIYYTVVVLKFSSFILREKLKINKKKYGLKISN